MKDLYSSSLASAKLTFIPAFLIISMVLITITGCDLLKEDLTGGTELTLEVEAEEAVKIETRQFRSHLKERLKEASISFSGAAVKKEDTIEISGLKEPGKEKIKEILADFSGEWEYRFIEEGMVLTLKQSAVKHIKEQAIFQALEVIKKRLSAFGLSEKYAEIETPGFDRLKVQIPPDVDSPRIKSLFRIPGILEFLPVVNGPFPTKEEALKASGSTLTDELKILKGDPLRGNKGYYIVKADPVITGRDIKKASRTLDQFNAPSVSLSLTTDGANRFRHYTEANIGQKLSIVLDNRVITAPVIKDVISHDMVVSGHFTIKEAEDLALILRSGGLPAPIKLIQERIIGKEDK
jgi:preprotein translocase subunit SecD